ncbi:MAG TPA: DUF1475 family protein [Bacteroidota bacterium]|nr:DUF1475 family protein [Bacteroidota bacterium]
MITFLKILFGALCAYMMYVVVTTSLESNLLQEWSHLGSIPWMTATLKDFYTNTVVLFAWVAYKERSVALKTLWLVLFVCLGSIAVTFYVLLQLFRLKPGEGIETVLLRKPVVARSSREP